VSSIRIFMLGFCVVDGVRVAVARWVAAVRVAGQISVDARPDYSAR
jgi:hypothetical protein